MKQKNGLNAVLKPFLSRSFVIEKASGEYGCSFDDVGLFLGE